MDKSSGYLPSILLIKKFKYIIDKKSYVIYNLKFNNNIKI